MGQGYIFTGVCDSVHRGGLPHCMLGYTPPGPEAGTPPRPGTPPPEQTPGADTPPGAGTPSAVHAGRYGQQAGGTHPTGMQSCFSNIFSRITHLLCTS